MITANMDCFEIHKCVLLAIPRINKKFSWVYKRAKRKLRKSGAESIPYYFPINVDKTKYIIVGRVTHKQMPFSINAFIPETNEYIKILPDKNPQILQAFSTHLLKRYAERALHNKDLPIYKIIRHMEDFDKFYVLAYYDETNKGVIYAVLSGFLFGTIDHEKGIIHLKTFVSKDMLHDNQTEIFNRLLVFMQDQQRKIIDALRTNRPVRECFSNPDAFEDLYKIYEEYYEK